MVVLFIVHQPVMADGQYVPWCGQIIEEFLCYHGFHLYLCTSVHSVHSYG